MPETVARTICRWTRASSSACAPRTTRVRWYLDVVPGICTDDQFLFGGCGLGAAIEALERTTGRPVGVGGGAVPLVRASARDRRHRRDRRRAPATRPPRRAPSHTSVTARSSPSTPRSVSATAGTTASGRASPTCRCPTTARRAQRISARRRLARAATRDAPRASAATSPRSTARATTATARSGRAFPAGLEVSAASLAILGDYVPFGVGQALGQFVTGSSLDNTLRVCTLVPTEWVLIDVRVHAIAHGLRPRAGASCGPRTARCSPPRASRASCARARCRRPTGRH